VAHALKDIRPVDARCLDPHEDLAFGRSRTQPHLDLEDVRTARPPGHDDAHHFGLPVHVDLLGPVSEATLLASIGDRKRRGHAVFRRSGAKSWKGLGAGAKFGEVRISACLDDVREDLLPEA
jgi:hypothetical protein